MLICEEFRTKNISKEIIDINVNGSVVMAPNKTRFSGFPPPKGGFEPTNLMILLFYYSKTMFLDSNQVYYWRFKCNTHNNYNYIIKTK